MSLTLEEKKKLIKRLKNAYRIIHRGDDKKMAHLDDPGKSTSNKFINSLRVDLDKRFGNEEKRKENNKDGIKTVTGYSLDSLRRFFFENSYLKINPRTVSNFEIFCKEIESRDNKFNKFVFTLKEKFTSYKYSFWVLIVTPILFLVLIISPFLGNKNSVSDGDKTTSDISGCYFTSDSTKHKILILPFKDYNSDIKNRDSGRTIAERLDSLNKVDKLGLDIIFCENINPTTTDVNYYKNIKEKFNADHIIYGYYSKDDTACAEGNTTKRRVCLNYITEFESPFETISKISTHSSYGNFKEASLKKLNKGYLQEDIDFLIYYSALQLSINNKEKKEASMRYFNKLAEFGKKEAQGRLYTASAEFNYSHFNDYYAITGGLVALDFISQKDNRLQAIAHNVIGRVYTIYGENKRALYHLTESYDKSIGITSFDFLFKANFELKYFEDNIKLTNAFLKEINNTNSKIFKKEERFNFLYINSFSKKLINPDYNFKPDSIDISNRYKKNYKKDFKIPFSTRKNLWNNAVYNRISNFLFEGRKNNPTIILKEGENVQDVYSKISELHGLAPKMIEHIFGNQVVIMDNNRKIVKELKEVVFNSDMNLNFIFSLDTLYREMPPLQSIKIQSN